MGVSITFLGGADTVTGSKYLVRHGQDSLLVDCGLFQGVKQLRLRNWSALPVAASDIGAVVLTHAHIDHSGYLPLLAKDYRGAVYATAATRDLCGILLPDSGHLQEEDAAFANRHAFSKHSPALPLYTKQDAIECLRLIQAQPFGQRFSPMSGWQVTYSHAGHILGAASVLIEVGGRRILFSGDLGRSDDLMMRGPERAPAADTVIIESTYGDREHPREDILAELGPALHKVAQRGGVAVVPVFAVGRAQAILHAISQLKIAGTLPSALPVFLDSPMAIHTTHLMGQYMEEHQLNHTQVRALTHSATMVSTPEASKALARRHGPMVILAASGMATGGRVLHHLSLYAGDHRNMILLTGFQAPGTRGASLAEHKSSVRIHGHDVSVNAEVLSLQSASAHADATQLMNWLHTLPERPEQVYVVHGERMASDALRCRMAHSLGWRALVPEHGATYPL